LTPSQMAFRMRRPLVLALALALSTTGAWADGYSDCRQTKDLDRQIRGCTHIIERGKQESAKNRTLAYTNRGTAYEKKGNKKQALADFRKALDINPMMRDAKRGLKRLGVTREELALYLKPGVFGTDDRRIINEEGSPWSAIGHINVPRASYCTGSLIASNLVITAAHCVMDPRTRKPWPVDKIHFVAGAKQLKWLGHSTAKCLHFPLGYEYTVVPKITDPALMSEEVPRRMFSRDMALIVLKDDLKNIPPLQIERAEELPADITLVHASYPVELRWMLSGHFGCHLLRRDQHLWYTDCDVYWGSSGGPIFVQRKQELNLAAIMVGAARKRHSIGVPIGDRIDLVAARKCP